MKRLDAIVLADMRDILAKHQCDDRSAADDVRLWMHRAPARCIMDLVRVAVDATMESLKADADSVEPEFVEPEFACPRCGERSVDRLEFDPDGSNYITCSSCGNRFDGDAWAD